MPRITNTVQIAIRTLVAGPAANDPTYLTREAWAMAA